MGLMYFLYRRIDIDHVIESVLNLGYVSLVAYGLNWFGGMFIPAIVVWQLAKIEARVALGEFLTINHVNKLYSMVVPLIVATGARFLQYVDAGISKQHSLVLLAANKIANVLNCLIGVIVAALILRPAVNSSYLDISIALCVLILVLSAVGFWMVHRFSTKKTPYKREILNKCAKLARAIVTLPKHKVASVLLISLVGHLLLTSAQWLLLVDIGHEIGFFEMIWVRSIISLMLMLPISVAGLGFRDISLVATLGIFGIPYPDAALVAIVLFVYQAGHAIIGFALEQKKLIGQFQK